MTFDWALPKLYSTTRPTFLFSEFQRVLPGSLSSLPQPLDIFSRPFSTSCENWCPPPKLRSCLSHNQLTEGNKQPVPNKSPAHESPVLRLLDRASLSSTGSQLVTICLYKQAQKVRREIQLSLSITPAIFSCLQKKKKITVESPDV